MFVNDFLFSYRYRRVRLPSVRDASLTDGLANGANEMEGMLGLPEKGGGQISGLLSDLTSGQSSKLVGNSRKSNVLGSKRRVFDDLKIF